MTPQKRTFQYGQHDVTLETGEIARQASGAVIVSMGDTVVLVTVVGSKETGGERDFFPLTVDYQERGYAIGKIPTNFFRREVGRPSERETLISRLIDRPIRPLFPEGFTQEVQIIATVMSVDPEIDPDIPAMIGASAALSISGIPFKEALGAARVAYIRGEYVLNPTANQLEQSALDLVVAGTASSVLMVESEAQELDEETMLGAVLYGHKEMQVVIDNINDLRDAVATPQWAWQAPVADETLTQQATELAEQRLRDAYKTVDKIERRELVTGICQEIAAKLAETEQWTEGKIFSTLEKIEKSIVRTPILAGEPRIGGRDTQTVRPITIRLGILPRTHGSALFTRGETQAVVVATMGTERDAQTIDTSMGESKDNFMLHYNFPPYCVGETGRAGSPKRREIGHGQLAKRGIKAVLPSIKSFPYVLRVVSEIMESNGSSSMASVCGTTLALMDAGVPIRAPVAGIAMGLIKEGDKFVVLSDIIGDEDHFGDMDFKVVGSREGITALQMDIKIDGITREIMEMALAQAREGRLHILRVMRKAIDVPRKEMSEYAPRITTMRVPPRKKGDVIGKGGATIRAITEETGAIIDIDDDGLVTISSKSVKSGEDARFRIEQIVKDVEVGEIYEGKVMRIVDFGAFVEVLPGRDGLLHISKISNERVEKVTDKLAEGQIVKVKVLEIDRQGKMKLSMKF